MLRWLVIRMSMSERKSATSRHRSLRMFLIVISFCEESLILNVLRESSLDNKHGTNNSKNFV